MFWVIRGTNPKNQADFALVVEATCRASAETWALKRGLPVAFLGRASEQDVLRAKQVHHLWRYTPEPRYKAFGRALAGRQLAFLLMLGLATIGLLLVRSA